MINRLFKPGRREGCGIVLAAFGLRLPPWLVFVGIGGLSGWLLPAAADMTAVSNQTGGGSDWAEPDQIGQAPGAPQTGPAAVSAPPSQDAAVAEAPAASEPEVIINGAKQSIGRPDVAPVVEVRTTYDDNIFIGHTNRVSDVYTTVVAGLAVGWGDFRDQVTPLGAFEETYEQLRTPDFDSRRFLFASYTPGYTAFVKNSDENTVNQNATVGARWSFGDLTCDLQANYRLFSDTTADVGTRAQESQFNIAMNNQYVMTARTGLEADLNVITHDYNLSSLVNSTEFVDRNYLNYQLLPKTMVSAGLVLGYVAVDEGPNQTYEQGLLRIAYDSGSKATANLFGGVEYRQFTEGAGDETNPVFGLQAKYAPVDGTTIQLQASRLVTNSAEYASQNIVTTGGTLSISQLLFQKVTLTLLGGYEHDQYGGVSGAGDIQRTDDEIEGEASLAFHVTAFMAVSLAYDYWHNISSLATYSFEDSRASIDLNLMF